jgi:serine/threonine protein kinase
MYMSPEQVRGKADAIDERSDIYSLCALFYELLALEPYIPPKDSVENVLRAVLTTTPRPPIKVRSPHQPPVPPELSHFVLKGLAKHPGDRFQTVVEMRDRLERIDEGYIPVQCPLTFSKRSLHAGLHLIDRHPFSALVFVITLGVAVVLGSIALATLALIG